MALDKITTDIIADDAVTAAKIPAGAIGTSEIAYFGDGTGNLSGTITNQQLHFGTAFTLTDNLTVNGDLILGKVRDDGTGQSITGSGRTLSGTGTLTMGSYVEGGEKDRVVTSASIPEGAITSSKLEQNVTIAGDFIPSTPLSHRNMIINGAMQVAQRGNGAGTATGGSGNYQTADRMHDFNNCVAANVTRETTAGVLGTESGNTFNDVFPYSWKWASNGTVASTPASDRVVFIYRFEGQDLQHLTKGTANAKAVTLSFWVKSTQEGNHQVNIRDDNSRMISAVYAVSSAGTWEKKVITFAGDTTGGLIDNDNSEGMAIEWWLTAGATYTSGAVPTSWEADSAGDRGVEQQNYVAGSGRTWQITGIQLELGSNATPFEHRSYADELLRCQRYFERWTTGGAYYTFGSGVCNGSNSAYGHFKYVSKRANPTFSHLNARMTDTVSDSPVVTGIVSTRLSINSGYIAFTAGSGSMVAGRGALIDAGNNTDSYVDFSSEL